MLRGLAMTQLGNGLGSAKHHKEALSVGEAELSTIRRLDASEERILVTKCCLAITYEDLGRTEEALNMYRDVYSGQLKLKGPQHLDTLRAAHNNANSLLGLKRFEEAKVLTRKTLPVARRILGEGHIITLKLRMNYAKALYNDSGTTLDNLREAVTTLEDTERTARRVFGGTHPTVVDIEDDLRMSRAFLRAREARPGS